ncbi:hypothetical protein CEV31_2611 [Brucella thiophenivorans]|uniref:Uncharacterized protein n=1 Tax=Brucella thiophenivorans TaxID=571255 RepID=A0A256FWR0_9HYPH|nr:hypothetical protein CEV31_2611 [Brucella thiophenivorans]
MKRNDEKWLKCGAFLILDFRHFKSSIYISTLTTKMLNKAFKDTAKLRHQG